MQLLNQLRADAGKIADEAIPEVVTAVDQLVPPTSLAKVVVALIGRLEQDIPGLIHVETGRLPHPLTTPVAEPEPAAAAHIPSQTDATDGEAARGNLARVEQELKVEREKVAALQASVTPAPETAPDVTTKQEAPVA